MKNNTKAGRLSAPAKVVADTPAGAEKLDGATKKFFSTIEICARILKATMSRFEGDEWPVTRIEQLLRAGNPDDRYIQALNPELKFPEVDDVQLDILTRFVIEEDGERELVVVNLESQNEHRLDRDPISRALYYLARMMVNFTQNQFTENTRAKLDKYVSIWIRYDVAASSRDSIQRYRLKEEFVYGTGRSFDCDYLEVIIVNIPPNGKSSGSEIIDLLSKILANVTPAEKFRKLEEHGIPCDQNLTEVVTEMTLGEGMIADAIEQATKKAKKQARKEGLEEGREEGRKEGLKEGRKEGLEEGTVTVKKEIAIELRQEEGFDVARIAKILKVTEEFVQEALSEG